MVNDLSTEIGTKRACNSFGIPRSSYYYWKKPASQNVLPKERKLPDFAYSQTEKKEILNVMNSDVYLNQTPYEIYASKLDELVKNMLYKCSEIKRFSTMI